jgi:GTP-binding protein
VLAVNKWDLSGPAGSRKRFEEQVRERLKFLAFAPLLFLSAKTGKGLAGLTQAVDRVHAAARTRVSTGLLNRVLAKAQQAHAPKAAKGNQAVKILFGSQIGVSPPTFVISLNHPVDLHFSYKRYLENQLRREFGFEGAPIVLKVRTRRH